MFFVVVAVLQLRITKAFISGRRRVCAVNCFRLTLPVLNQHTRGLISAQKTSHRHNDKDLSHL